MTPEEQRAYKREWARKSRARPHGKWKCDYCDDRFSNELGKSVHTGMKHPGLHVPKKQSWAQRIASGWVPPKKQPRIKKGA